MNKLAEQSQFDMKSVVKFPDSKAETTKAIDALDEAFARQKAAFLKDQYPDADTRIERVSLFIDMFKKYRVEVQEALTADYGNNPKASADLFDSGVMIGRAEYAIKNIKRWMKPEKRKLSPLFGASTACMRLEPKGVVANMSAWNFPFDISCGPTIDALAAGNRVIIKPSEVTPNSALLLQKMIEEYFDPEIVTTAIGGVKLAEYFSTLPWDHLVYTGNSRIARSVMTSCAQNLVPVTLELGGKSPVILDATRIDAEAARRIMGLKAIKRGQVCVNADYVLVPRAQMASLVELLKADINANLMQNNAAQESCAIVSDRHLKAQREVLKQAEDAGANILSFGDPDPKWARNMPFSLVVDPPEGVDMMKREIFGPVLPIVPYGSTQEALDYINSHASPLGVYIFSEDDEFVSNVIDNTRSGGVSVNAAAAHVQPELGFGGIGESGMGRHHGVDGFREFSNHRAIVNVRKAPGFDYLLPPYDENTTAMLNALFGEAKDQVAFALKLIPRNIMALLKR